MNTKAMLRDDDTGFDIEPWPQCAPAYNGVTVAPYKTMTPTSESAFAAEFKVQEPTAVNCVAVRYGKFRPHFLQLQEDVVILPAERLTLSYRS